VRREIRIKERVFVFMDRFCLFALNTAMTK